MKTIFFVVATKTRINFILRSNLFKNVKERGFRIVIVTPFWNQPEFVREFGGRAVAIEPLRTMGRASLTLNYWRSRAMEGQHPATQFAIQAHRFMTRRFRHPSFAARVRAAIRRAIFALLPSSIRKSPAFWDWLENMFLSSACAADLFKKHRPAVVVLSSAGAEGADVPFLLASKKCGIPSLVIDSNIDAPQMRYHAPPRDATVYAVFGDEMKHEFMEIHNIPESKIVCTGPLRYDFYFREFKPMPREEFCRKIGVDPLKKLITFGAKIPIMFPHNADIIRMIVEAIQNGVFRKPSQLFVRFDPGHDPSQYPELLPKIRYERTEEASYREHVANLLYHSDVAVSIASTFSIEACLVGTPAIWIGFDGYTMYPTRIESTRSHYDHIVFKRIVATGGISLAETPEQLIDWINRYLENRSLNQAERRRMIDLLYAPHDGRAAERIADAIVALSN